jgi:hypothetical protein
MLAWNMFRDRKYSGRAMVELELRREGGLVLGTAHAGVITGPGGRDRRLAGAGASKPEP